MNTKLYLGNLAATITESDLMILFSAYGNVVDVSLPAQRSRGSGVVTMVTPEGARAAIQALHGRRIGACALSVSEVCPVEDPAGLPDGRRTPRRCASQLF
jgi:RNA recognition motif-containing protein